MISVSLAQLLFVTLAAASAKAAPEPRSIPLPALAKAPVVDGKLKDLAGGVALKSQQESGKPSFLARVGLRKDVVYVGVEVVDDKLAATDAVELNLHFPGAGATAPGYVFSFSASGMLTPEDNPTPKWALDAVKSKVVTGPKGMSLEAALPPEALPRWPSKDPLLLEVCVKFQSASNCDSGSMATPLKLPEEYRRAFKLKIPDRVLGVERVNRGWVGYGTLHYPVWIESDAELTPENIRGFVNDPALDPEQVHVPLPAHMSAPDGRSIAAMITGADPYGIQDQCDMAKELRLAMYAYQGHVATRVLEWTAANCALGRAASISLDAEGSLSIGYANGATTTFTWSGDHFEQTQLGMR
jgi:hypothetical protein